eukprot:PLAT13992.4.p1 GENE.PLAT13992.4~~PLAT13992.4.p1  ORF type:complete len:593 (-),score=309.18 PLAT13992.4:232-1920(-)
MKALLLDKDTKGIVSSVVSQTDILEKQVYLIELVTAPHESMRHLTAVVFVRGTDEAVAALQAELKRPSFGGYHLFFTSFVTHDQLTAVAEADEHELVRGVQEAYADYFALSDEMFSLQLPYSMSLSRPRARWNDADEDVFSRSVQGVLSVLLSLKRRAHIRYQGSSELAKLLARELKSVISSEPALFDFPRGEAPVLLILDRRDDPVTPLLSQWTYEAMVHELIGINNHRVSMSHVPGIRSELRDVVLTPGEDDFFTTHMYSNFGELGVAVRRLLEGYKKEKALHTDISTVEDMQRFVEAYPEFKKQSSNVSKHVALVGELARLVDLHCLMEVSALEQELSCADEHREQYRDVQDKILHPQVSAVDALRLVLLFALHYEKTDRDGGEVRALKGMLREKGVSEDDVGLVDSVIRYAGEDVRGGDLFGNKSFIAKGLTSIKRGLAGVENVYTQHEPVLCGILDKLLNNKLKESAFPFSVGSPSRERPAEVIVFIMGGVTHEEALKVHALNEAGGARILIGGTFVHNSRSFLKDLKRAYPPRYEAMSGGGGGGGSGSGGARAGRV